MFSQIFYILFFPIIYVDCIRIAFIQNIILIPRYQWNGTTLVNRTKSQCFCTALSSSFIAFNWFPNNTCQLFKTFPITYKIQSTPYARLYFPQKIYPNTSQCCMPDINYVLAKLKNGTRTYVNASYPRNLIFDDRGYLVTVELNPPKLSQFDSVNLKMINQIALTHNSYAMAVGFQNNAYFVEHNSGYITVLDRKNLNVQITYFLNYVNAMRGIIFFDNGNTMVISSYGTNSIVFLKRINNASFNYTYTYQQQDSYTGVHGLTRINDTYFLATSYTNNAVYSYSIVQNSSLWTERLVIDATNAQNINGATFVTVDECGRYWLSLDSSTVHIFDSLGLWIGKLDFGSAQIIDTLIADNYVMYFSNRFTGGSRIIRIDPHIQC